MSSIKTRKLVQRLVNALSSRFAPQVLSQSSNNIINEASQALLEARNWLSSVEEEDLNSDMSDLIRYMCSIWAEIDDWAQTNCGDQLDSYPEIENVSNQLALRKIAEQPFDVKKVRSAIRKMNGRQVPEANSAFDLDRFIETYQYSVVPAHINPPATNYLSSSNPIPPSKNEF